MNIIGITAAALCACVLVLSLRQIRPEIAHIITVCASVMLFLSIMPYAAELIKAVKDFAVLSSSGGKYVEPIIKITGIAYITQLGAELCTDAGEKSLASRVEMAGKIAICMITLPIAREAFVRIIGILK